MAGVITAAEPSWIPPFTGLRSRDFRKLVTLLRREGGAGLPWVEIWPAVAQALSPYPIGNVDLRIQQLLNGGLAGYLTYDTEDGRRVYRPGPLACSCEVLVGLAGVEFFPSREQHVHQDDSEIQG